MHVAARGNATHIKEVNHEDTELANTSLIGSILFEVSDGFDINFSVDVGDEFRTYGIGFRYSPMNSDID